MSSSFYITLPSNSSMFFYPSNTLTNYVTKLPQAVDLTGEWKVGLFELQFPVSYYNLTDEETKPLMYTNFDNKMIRTGVSPPSGYYENPGLLVREINEVVALVESRNNLVRFCYNEISKKISVQAVNNITNVSSHNRQRQTCCIVSIYYYCSINM
jgi:hypothetical protein